MALVRTDVLEAFIASLVRMTSIGELGTTLVVTSNRSTLLTLFLARRHILPKRRFLQEPHNITSQKTAFLMVIAVETSCLTYSTLNYIIFCIFPRLSFIKLLILSPKTRREERDIGGGGGVRYILEGGSNVILLEVSIVSSSCPYGMGRVEVKTLVMGG
jgi:hypothetical protein